MAGEDPPYRLDDLLDSILVQADNLQGLIKGLREGDLRKFYSECAKYRSKPLPNEDTSINELINIELTAQYFHSPLPGPQHTPLLPPHPIKEQ